MPSLRRVNSEQAHLVANAFGAAPSVPSNPTVRAAYAELSDQARSRFARLTTDHARRPTGVVFTRCREPYADAQELSESVRCNHVLEIFPAAYERDRQHPFLDAAVGGAHDCLWAVHDIVSLAGSGIRSIVTASSPPGTWSIVCTRAWPGGHWRRSCTRSTACSGRPVSSPNSRRRFSPLISSSRSLRGRAMTTNNSRNDRR